MSITGALKCVCIERGERVVYRGKLLYDWVLWLSGRGLLPEHFMIYILQQYNTGDVDSTSTKASVHEAYPEKE